MRGALILGLVLFLILLLALVKIGVDARYTPDGLDVFLKICGFRFPLLKQGKEKTQKRKKEKRVQGEPEENPLPKERAQYKRLARVLLSQWQEILSLIKKVLLSPTVDEISLNITVGNPDPAAAALEYGRICAGIGVAIPLVESTFRVRRRNIQISVDYAKERTEISGAVRLFLRVWEIVALLGAVLAVGFQTWKKMKSEKAV